MSFTREEALRFHLDMWNKIKKKYGSNASSRQRAEVKREYLRKKGHACISNCYLYEYSIEEKQRNWVDDCCTLCPIDWSILANENDPDRGSCTALYKNGYDSIYGCAPIDEILALPERKRGE